MIHLLGKVPRDIVIGVSGGLDSIGALRFLARKHKVTVCHIHHHDYPTAGTDVVEQVASELGVKVDHHSICTTKPLKKSLEEHWRDERYKIFRSYSVPVVTAHTIDDVMETWIWSSLHGCSKTIPYSNRNVIRPFLLTDRIEFKKWTTSWWDDPTNKDPAFIRNYIRHELLPRALVVNPGLRKVIRKKILSEFNLTSTKSKC